MSMYGRSNWWGFRDGLLRGIFVKGNFGILKILLTNLNSYIYCNGKRSDVTCILHARSETSGCGCSSQWVKHVNLVFLCVIVLDFSLFSAYVSPRSRLKVLHIPK